MGYCQLSVGDEEIKLSDGGESHCGHVSQRAQPGRESAPHLVFHGRGLGKERGGLLASGIACVDAAAQWSETRIVAVVDEEMWDSGSVGIEYGHRRGHIGYGDGIEIHLGAVAADVATLEGECLELEKLRVVGHMAGGEAAECSADVVDTHQHVKQPGERPGGSRI